MNSAKSNGETGNGLEELGIPGQVYLRDALTSCTDPLKAIEGFQVKAIEPTASFVKYNNLTYTFYPWKCLATSKGQFHKLL